MHYKDIPFGMKLFWESPHTNTEELCSTVMPEFGPQKMTEVLLNGGSSTIMRNLGTTHTTIADSDHRVIKESFLGITKKTDVSGLG